MIHKMEGGTYQLSEPIRVGSQDVLEGVGVATRLVAMGDFPCIDMIGPYATVRNLAMTSETPGQGIGIDFTKSDSNNRVEGCWFFGGLKIGLNITPAQRAGLFLFRDIRFDVVDGMAWGAIVGDGANLCSDVTFENLSLTTLKGMVGAVAVRNRVDTLKISGTLVGFNSCPTGISIGVPHIDGDVTGVELNVVVDSFSASGIQAHKVSNLRIMGGSFNMNPIRLEAGVRGAVVYGATIQACPGSGLYLDRAKAVRVMDNLICDNATEQQGSRPIAYTPGTDWMMSGNRFGNDVLWQNTGHQAMQL